MHSFKRMPAGGHWRLAEKGQGEAVVQSGTRIFLASSFFEADGKPRAPSRASAAGMSMPMLCNHLALMNVAGSPAATPAIEDAAASLASFRSLPLPPTGLPQQSPAWQQQPGYQHMLVDQQQQVLPPHSHMQLACMQGAPAAMMGSPAMLEEGLLHTGALTSSAGRPAEPLSEAGDLAGSIDGAAFLHDSDSDGQEALEKEIQEHLTTAKDLTERKRLGEARAHERRANKRPHTLSEETKMSDAAIDAIIARMNVEKQRRGQHNSEPSTRAVEVGTPSVEQSRRVGLLALTGSPGLVAVEVPSPDERERRLAHCEVLGGHGNDDDTGAIGNTGLPAC